MFATNNAVMTRQTNARQRHIRHITENRVTIIMNDTNRWGIKYYSNNTETRMHGLSKIDTGIRTLEEATVELAAADLEADCNDHNNNNNNNNDDDERI